MYLQLHFPYVWIRCGNSNSPCVQCSTSVVFVLYGDVSTIAGIVEHIKEAGKTVVVHMDLIAGLSSRVEAVDFISPFLIIALFSAHPGIPGGCFLYILRDNPLYKNLLLLFSYKDE